MWKPIKYCPAIMWLTLLLLPGIAGCGAGQHEKSPDGRYDAHATFYYNGSSEWLELEVRNNTWGTVLWKKNMGNRKDHHPPFDQGFGNLDLIQWADDSKEVRFAHKSHEVSEVVEWLTVKFDEHGEVIETAIVPDSQISSTKSDANDNLNGNADSKKSLGKESTE